MLFNAALTWALQLFSSSPQSPISSPGLIDRSLEDKIHHLRQEWDVPGLTVTIVASPNYTRAGFAATDWRTTYISSGIRAVGDKVTPDTLWSIASNSKFFVSLSVGLLIDDGVTLETGEKLSWNTRVKDVLGWTLMDKYMEEHVTLGDMLSMQSGLPRHDEAAERDATPEEMLRQMAHFRPSTGIREHWQYNNYHYQITPLLFPKYANMSFVDFVQTRIWDPLDMGAMYNFTKAEASGRLSESFLRRNWKTECNEYSIECFGEVGSGGYWNAGHDNIGMAGAGGVVMSSRDMAKWLREVLDPKVIPKDVLHDVLGGRAVANRYPTYPEIGLDTYCLGQETYNYRGHQVYQHTGGLPGQLSYFMRIPERGIGVFTEANDNGMGPYIGNAIAYMVLDHLLELPPVDWAGRYLRDAIETKGKRANEPIPTHPREASDITGKYSNPAYGGLDIRESHDDRFPGYVAEVYKFFASHIVFTHIDGPIWQWSLTRAYPDRNGTWLYPVSHGTCVFKDGLGLFGNFWGQGGGLPVSKPDEQDPEKSAEVWFAKE